MTEAQERALRDLCDRYHVPFDAKDYLPAFDLPEGYVSGWIGGTTHRRLYVGCSADGRISS